MRSRRPEVLGLVAVVVAGCAGDGARRVRSSHVGEGAPATAGVVVEPAGSRPRLRHTVTLGESVGGEVPEGAPPPDAPGTSPGVVVIAPGYGAGWSGAPGWVSEWDAWSPYPGWYGPLPDDRPVRRPASTRPWTPPPEYGPRFPFKTAPADPWR